MNCIRNADWELEAPLSIDVLAKVGHAQETHTNVAMKALRITHRDKLAIDRSTKGMSLKIIYQCGGGWYLQACDSPRNLPVSAASEAVYSRMRLFYFAIIKGPQFHPRVKMPSAPEK